MILQFDEKRLINDIIKALNKEMDKVAEVLIQFMIGEIAGMSINSADPELGQWKLDVIEALHYRSVASADEICKEVGILDQSNAGLMDMALSLNFGTGLLADTADNPWYGEFTSSKYYHDSRENMQIYSLPGEDVFDPESNTWQKSNATSRVAMPQFAQEGSKYWTNIFGNSSIMAETYFNKGIDAAMDSIDFSNYLIVK